MQSAACGLSIDLDTSPLCPERWTIVEHIQQGRMEWNERLIQLFLSEQQKSGKIIQGCELKKELVSKPVLNACVLDFLFLHAELIPENWGNNKVFFWGTIYRNSANVLCVRYIVRLGRDCYWSYKCLERHWKENNPAALLIV